MSFIKFGDYSPFLTRTPWKENKNIFPCKLLVFLRWPPGQSAELEADLLLGEEKQFVVVVLSSILHLTYTMNAERPGQR